MIVQKFGLVELDRYNDPQILALADKVSHRADPETGYPKHLSGEVIVTMKNGERLSHREQINRGAPENPLAEADIVAKFMSNAELAVPRPHAEEIRDRILALDEAEGSVRVLAAECALNA